MATLAQVEGEYTSVDDVGIDLDVSDADPEASSLPAFWYVPFPSFGSKSVLCLFPAYRSRITYDHILSLQRTFLKSPERKGNIPIHAIGLSLYESLPGMTAEQIGAEVIRTQWL